MKSITPNALEKVFQHFQRAFDLFTLTLLFFTSFFILNQNAEAQLSCPMHGIQQITNETVGLSLEPSTNADGTRIAFESQADINGGTLRGTERYTFSIQQQG